MDSVGDNVEMAFKINFKDPIIVKYTNLKTETVADLKQVVSEHYQLTDIDLLDLGRFMRDTELLINQSRTEYTLYIPRKTKLT